MTNLSYWPSTLPATLADLPQRVAETLGAQATVIDEHSELASASGPLLIVLGNPHLAITEFLTSLDRVISAREDPTAIVIGDGWIGTDGPGIEAALAGASAVAVTRSVAARRTRTGRVNIVCVPEALLGDAGEQRGPLTLDIQSAEVADVAAFLLGDESSYIDGQVLYANGGRQLFSSLTA